MAYDFTNTTTGANGNPSTSTTSINLSGMQSPTNVTVDPKTQTVAGQLSNIISSDNPLMEQARTRAQQGMNQRGLLNSSMTQTAADSAMYQAALPIAQQDAQTYNDAAKTNASTQNTFALTQNNQAADLNKLQTQQNFNLQNLQKQQDFTQQNLATQQANDLAKLDKTNENSIKLANIDANFKNVIQGSASATSIVNKMQDSLNALAQNTSITDPAVRDQLAADIKANAADSLNLIGALAGNIDLSNYVKQIGL